MVQEYSDQADQDPADYVLVVDDDPDVRHIMTVVLQDEGYRTETASNGQEALDRLRIGKPPCVMLLDLMMPGMDGWQVVSAMRSNGVLQYIPIVVTSAFAAKAPTNVERILRKPLNLSRLLSAVEEFCRPDDSGAGGTCVPVGSA